MLHNSLAATNSWSNSVTRLGFGGVGLFVAHLFEVVNLPGDPLSISLDGGNNSLIGFVVFLLASLILGAVILAIGDTVSPRDFSPRMRMERALRVGKTNNALFAQAYQNEMQKLDMAIGFVGLMIFFVFLFAINLLPPTSVFLSPSRLGFSKPGDFSWISLIVILLAGYGFGYALKHSAFSGLRAIDDVLAETDTATEQ